MQQQLQRALVAGLRLYYNILKLHRKVLPSNMRAIGDIYLRQEFKYHHEQPQIEFYGQFYAKWQQYYLELSNKGLKQTARNISKREEELLTNDQKEALRKLKEGLQK